MKTIIMITVAVTLVGTAFAETHVVPSAGETLGSSATYDTLSIKGNLTVNDNALIKATAAQSEIMPDAAGLATITLEGGGNLDFKGSNFSSVLIGAGGGDGRFVVSSASQSGQRASLYANGMIYSANATPAADGIFDLMTLNAGATAQPGLVDAKSKGTIPVRIRFNGGQYLIGYQTSGSSDGCYIFRLNQGQCVELASVEGRPIRLKWDYTTQQTFFGGGYAMTSGDGDAVLDSNYNNNGAGILMCGNRNNGNYIQWAHAGDLVLTNKFILTCSSNRPDVLPHGTNQGDVRLYGDAGINFGGNTNIVNSLYTSGNAKIWSSATGGKLVMGTHDRDATLRATIGQNLLVQKFGTANLYITNTVSSGGLEIFGGCVTVADHATDFSGAATVASGATVRYGQTVADLASWKGVEGFASLSGAGTFVKAGNSYCHWNASRTLPDNVCVSGGVLRFAAPVCENKWYRFTFKKTRGNETLTIHALALIDKNGNDLTTNKGYAGSLSDDEANMTAGSYVFPTTTKYETDTCSYNSALTGGINYLTSDDGYKEMIWKSTPDPANDSTWLKVTFRLKDDAAAVTGYALYRDWINSHVPEDWIVETSANGTDWTVIDERTGYRADFQDTNSGLGWWNKKCPICWNRGAALDAATLTGKSIALAGGAKLDTDPLAAANVTLAALSLDCAATNTITKFAPASTGSLYLTNIPAGTMLKRYVVPVKFGTVVGGAALDSWNLYIDGVKTKEYRCALNAAGDGIVLKGNSGLIVIFR